MSDETKNCCPPETTAPKLEVHDADACSKDIKPKFVSTAHKQLSKDEFQRKVAMLARAKAANAGTALMVLPKVIAAGAKPAAAAASRLPSLRTALGALGLGAVGAGGAAVGTSGTGRPSPTASTQAPPPKKPAAAGGGMQFSDITDSLKNNYSSLAANFGGHVGAGGVLGAGLGGIAGALMPGEEEYEDEYGRMRKRRGSRLAGALRGAGLGGLAGGGIGAGVAGVNAYNSGALKFGAAIANLEKIAVGAGPGLSSPAPWAKPTAQGTPAARIGASKKQQDLIKKQPILAAPRGEGPRDMSAVYEGGHAINANQNPDATSMFAQHMRDNPLASANNLLRLPYQNATPQVSRNPSAVRPIITQPGSGFKSTTLTPLYDDYRQQRPNYGLD